MIIMMPTILLAPMPNKTLIVIAISSRPYVKAARDAGFDVIAVDAFVDADTQAMAKQCIQVACAHGSFDANALLQTLDTLDAANIFGVCYGAGFEAQPELLTKISQRFRLFGNTAEAVAACKQPQILAAFCQANQFLTPAISLTAPAVLDGWLVKTVGGSGGAHVQWANAYQVPLQTNQYFQQMQTGTPVSCLYLASQQQVTIIGMNEQWVDADQHAPFKYGGAVSHIALSAQVVETFKRFATLASQQFNLKGLNSVDAVLDGERLVFLEINPRLSATVDLYMPQVGTLMASHVSAFEADTMPPLVLSTQSKAHHIVYAQQPVHISADQSWPDWVSDIPNQSQLFEAGMPICTVTAFAENVQEAKRLVQARAGNI